MNSKIILVSALVLAGIGGLMFWGRANQTSTTASVQGAQSALVANESLYDFGTISMKDDIVSRMFTVTNQNERAVLVTDIATSCMCTTAYLVGEGGMKRGPFGMPGHGGPSPKANETIPAGESRSIEVVYDPNAHGPAGVGAMDRFIYLTDISGGTLALEIKANVTP